MSEGEESSSAGSTDCEGGSEDPPSPSQLSDTESQFDRGGVASLYDDEDEMQLQALLGLNGALARAIAERDAQLKEMAARAKAEHRRLHLQLKEAQRLAKDGVGPDCRDPVAQRLLKISRRVREAEQELRYHTKRRLAAQAQAEELEAELRAAEEASVTTAATTTASTATTVIAAPTPTNTNTTLCGQGDTSAPSEQGDGEDEGDGEEGVERGGGEGAAEAEETLDQLTEQLQRATQRMLELRAQNSLLRHDILMAKKVLAAEVGDAAVASAAMEAATGGGSGWKGRAEQISALNLKAAEMQEQLAQLRDECSQLRQQLEGSSTEDVLHPVTRVAVTPKESSAPLDANSWSVASSLESAGPWPPGQGAQGAAPVPVVARAAVERRAAAEAAAREAQAQAEAADAQAHAQRALNARAESVVHALRERLAQLQAKTKHDQQLAEAVNAQVSAAEAQVRECERKLQMSAEAFNQERNSLEQQLARAKSVSSTLQSLLSEKEKLLKEHNAYDMDRKDDSVASRNKSERKNSSKSPSEKAQANARAGVLRALLNERTAERARLQHIVDQLSRRMAERQRRLDATNEALRAERGRTASLETDIARLELQRGSGPALGAGGGRERAVPDDCKTRLVLMEEENSVLRERLQQLLRDREEELRLCAGLLDPRLTLPLARVSSSPRRFQLAEHTKLAVYRELERRPRTPVPEGCPTRPPQEALEALQAMAVSVAPPPITPEWEDEIRNMLPPVLVERYWGLYSELMEEVRREYDEAMAEHAKEYKLRPSDADEWPQKIIKPYLAGHTARYPLFLKRRRRLLLNLHLLHPIIHGLFTASVIALPETMTDWASYREMGAMDLGKLRLIAMTDVHKTEAVVARWYQRVVMRITEKRALSAVPMDKRPAFVDCATNIIRVQITELKRRTAQALLDLFNTPKKMPMIRMELGYNEKITLYPDMEEYVSSFRQMLDKVFSVSSSLTSLETYLPEVPRKRKLIATDVRDGFDQYVTQQLHERAKKLYQPINRYVRSMRKEFLGVYGIDAMDEVLEFLKKPNVSFEQCYLRAAYYASYLRQLSNLTARIYYAIARVNQQPVIRHLRAFALEYIEMIGKKCMDIFLEDLEKYCKLFEAVSRRAKVEPHSTEELMELSAYSLWASTVLLKRIRNRLGVAAQRLAVLAEVGEFTPEFKAKTTEAFEWLDKIHPVFEENSSLFETYKAQFEDELVRRTEKLKVDIDKMFPRLVILDLMDEADRVDDYLRYMSKFLRKMEHFDREVAWINKEETLFKYALSNYPKLEILRNYIYPFAELLHLVQRWYRALRKWNYGNFEDLVFEEVEQQVEDFYREFAKMQKFFRAQIKDASDDNNPIRFRGLVEDPDITKLAAPLKLTMKCLGQVKDFRPKMQYIELLRNPAMGRKHWDELKEAVGFDITPDAGTTLDKIMALKLDKHMEEFEVVSMSANKEKALRDLLAAMKKEWESVCFETMAFGDLDCPILAKVSDVQAVLDDHLMKTLSMKGSVFVKPIEAETNEWYDMLQRVNDTVDKWGKVQAQWLHLLPIFSSEDIVKQMPTEGQLFQKVDQTYRKLMTQVKRDPHVLFVAGAPGVLESLQEAIDLLDQIGDGVNAYLEKKRLYFARFFFLSNDEMLEILSETKDPLRVQPHIRKCFEGIEKLKFNNNMDILAMISSEGETVPIVKQISTKKAGGSVEKWLLQVEDQMKITVRDQIEKANKDYAAKPRKKWVVDWPGQVVICVSQIYWTADMHRCLNSKNRADIEYYGKQLLRQINDIVALVRGDLSSMSRITLEALVVIDVHAKDVTIDLQEKEISSDKDFAWQACMRYYWEKASPAEAWVRCTNAKVHYFYEYLGNSSRLVITPLTDRCYRTLIGAYHLHLNGAPEGPAGTGKTETTKDLAKAIAVCCVVFNCSDGLDYKAMGKFFKGLASAGAWACFDEFNRIDLEVLSVIAQQILCIIQAVRAAVETFVFEGTEIRLNPACYVAITMNPGYAGRSELPDNLKVLFRTVAMMVPNYALIGEISLYSFGFVNARVLSVKIVTAYRLCSEQLSSQNHYDYGMRAVKSVLSAAGSLKRHFPSESEDVLVMRSILDVNLPKFLSHDVPLFEGIMSDLFRGVVLPSTDYHIFIDAINRVCRQENLQNVPAFQLKVTQTYEMMLVRHGFMLVGMPVSGKSSVLKVLSKALTLMSEEGENEQTVEYTVMNPKAITMGQLFGEFDPVSYVWSDGVLAKVFRKYAYASAPGRKWVVFDGPVDAVWIENMNTVLDDNKKLCLTSGDIIQMTPRMSMIFEVMDLAQASPATVSRCGMIYLEPSSLGWEPLAESWCATGSPLYLTGDFGLLMHALIMWVVDPTLEFVRLHCTEIVSPGVPTLVIAFLNMLRMLLDDAVSVNKYDEKVNSADGLSDSDKSFVRIWIMAAFLYATVWTLGGMLDAPSRNKFDVFVKDFWEGPNAKPPAELGEVDISIPPTGILHDYYYNFKDKGVWKYWPECLRDIPIVESINIAEMVVPTLDSAKYQYVMDLHLRHRKRMLLVGETGTGKSMYFQHKLMTQLTDKYEPSFITFTAQVTANQTQNLIISKLLKRRKGIYGPQRGNQAVIFVDNINMPAKEIYGAQPPLELLRQYFDIGIWYDLKDTTRILLEDVMFMAAMGPPGGSRQDVYQRFLRHWAMYSICPFSAESLTRIFTNVLLVGLKRRGFAGDVFGPVQNIVNGTLILYTAALEHLRPTPAKSHYVFNLRDFSRVVQGCSLVRKESLDQNKNLFQKLFVHESLRVFGDRLVDEADHKWMLDRIREALQATFKENIDNTFKDITGKDKVELGDLKQLMFGNFLDPNAIEDEKRYEQVPSMDRMRTVAQGALDEYNSTHKAKMNIVLFEYALEHLCHICRVLSVPAGNALLVGVGGSGRQSLSRLATAVTGNAFFQPEITKTYSLNDWRDDLKGLLKTSGGGNRDTTFLLTEAQVETEAYLQDVDALLNSGEVPNLYALDERQEILEMVRLAAQGGNRNLDLSGLRVFNFFVNRCKEKLHIVLCFSPIGASFRSRLRLFPSLVNCCTIDWFEVWPEDALDKVAQKYMKGLSLPEKVKVSCMDALKHFHVFARDMSNKFFVETRRKTYVTSPAYLELISSFSNLITSKQEELTEARNRYLGGLDKLAFAAKQVTELQKELSQLQPELEAAANETKQMVEKIDQETVTVQKASEQVRRDEVVANEQAQASTKLKDECERDLQAALPALNDALAALNTLKPSDITLVKSMKNPPETVKLVMAAVCVMKGVKPEKTVDKDSGKKTLDYWGPSKRLLGDMYFLQSLKDYDKDHIPPEVMKKIRTEFIPNKDFKPHIVAKASSAAEGLCKWVIAMDLYDVVAKEVAPKRAKLEAAEKELAATEALLNQKREELRTLEARLADLTKSLEEAEERRQQLESDVEDLRNKLVRAEKIIGGLGGERNRWTNEAKRLQGEFDNVAGDILISCGVIAYLGPFSATYRSACLDDWHQYTLDLKIPCSRVFSFRKVLGSDITIQNWNICGLPRDAFSVDNGIIVEKTSRWSLMVDPQSQANKWIKSLEKENHLACIKFSHPDYMKTVERAVKSGSPVLLENVQEDLEAPLDPILFKQTFTQGKFVFISLGDNVVEYNSNFRFYMTSKLRNPHFLPEVCNKVTVVNFALTVDGLEDQLLGIVVAKERPDLERNRQRLIVEGAQNKAGLKKVEDSILITLSESSGNILEDEKAVKVLDSSKVLATEIQKKEEAAKVTAKEIEEFRTSYRPLAHHSAVLYYCVTDLPNVDPMYQYSLAWFINLYIGSIDRCHTSTKQLSTRLAALKDAFCFNLYSNVCRSLFEKDKLLFSFVQCANIMMAQDEMDRTSLMFFLTGGVGLENTLANPAPAWLPDKSWDEICRIDELSMFKGFRDHLESNLEQWKRYSEKPEPQTEPLPEPWESRLKSFERLLVLRVMRPDKLVAAVRAFVEEHMGPRYTLPPAFDIEKSYDDSDTLVPLIFILSPGADPMAALLKFAERMGVGQQFNSISLGQGQGPIAAKMIKAAQEEGGWVCLQNCHLAVSWLPQLEYIWENFDPRTTHRNFRLWLTSYPSDKFPTSILQFGVKMTNEPPTGLQQNMKRSYMSEPLRDSEFYSSCPNNPVEFARLLYGMCFFHAVVQERRKYGAIGWNIPYGFNESDLHISIQQLQMFISENEQVPYPAIQYMTGECNYGGRVTDDWDRRCLTTILENFVNPRVGSDASYLFCDEEGAHYGLPARIKYSDVLSFIEAMPAEPPPAVYGLHTNAGVIRALGEASTFCNTMLLVVGEGTGGGDDGSVRLSDITKGILSKLPADFNIEEASEKFPVVYEESMNTVLTQEMQRFNKLLEVMRTSLEQLDKALVGIVVMTPELDQVAGSLSVGKVPTMWATASYPSLKPLGGYVADFLERIAFLERWYETEKPITFWLSGFYFTQAFLTGAMQNFARKHMLAINTLTYDFKVMDMEGSQKVTRAPSDGVLVYGFFLDGARWDRDTRCMQEQRPKQLRDPMPLVWIKPLESDELDEAGRFECPLYKTSERRGVLSTTGHSTNYVLPFLLDTKLPPAHWVQRGAALLLALDD